MSLKHLPPVYEYWSDVDLDLLSKEDLERLQLTLRKKIEVITDRYERELFFKDKDSYMQLKTLVYRQAPKRDFPF